MAGRHWHAAVHCGSHKEWLCWVPVDGALKVASESGGFVCMFCGDGCWRGVGKSRGFRD